MDQDALVLVAELRDRFRRIQEDCVQMGVRRGIGVIYEPDFDVIFWGDT